MDAEPTPISSAWPPLVIRLITGSLLLYSGWLKLGDLNSFANTLDTMQLPVLRDHPGLLLQFAESLPWFELGLGVLLVSTFAARPASLVAGMLFLAFTVLLTSLRLQGFEGECGCLGPLLSARVGWLHVILDALVTVACFAAAFGWRNQPTMDTTSSSAETPATSE
ncbi:MAG: hypothetical protein CMO74_11140 [Verrucomicrobiales bacterium]|nr:hypothetical protein [Verrucomicrobiales bacterium]|tara:strand:- start:72489 stop:72986 length:498 start_codon:yes stop_codon:yes gene_type:complete